VSHHQLAFMKLHILDFATDGRTIDYTGLIPSSGSTENGTWGVNNHGERSPKRGSLAPQHAWGRL
jgi:hypothetical protein